MNKINKTGNKESHISQIKTLIFDGGGTIWDSSQSIYESYLWGFRQLGLNFALPAEACHHLRGLRDFNTSAGIAKALLWASNSFERGKYPLFLEKPGANSYLKEEIRKYKKENVSFLKLAGRLARLFDDYLYNKIKDTDYTLLPYTAEILKTLHRKNYQIVMLSIRHYVSVKRILRHHKLYIYFSHIFSTESFQEGGKTKEAVKDALETLMQTPENILWIGDSGVDISCAKEAGIFAAGVLTGLANRQTLLDEGADWILNDIGGLKDILKIDS